MNDNFLLHLLEKFLLPVDSGRVTYTHSAAHPLSTDIYWNWLAWKTEGALPSASNIFNKVTKVFHQDYAAETKNVVKKQLYIKAF